MITLITITIGLFLLVRSADVFVNQASAFAKKIKVNDFIIGFTVVAFGTSLPELISTLFSAFSGHNQLVVSNIIGSNITNLCLIFGLVALFNNYQIKKRDVDINIPLNMAAMMFFWALSVYMGFVLNWSAGVSLILIFLIIIILAKDYNHFEHSKKEYPDFKPIILAGSLGLMIVAGKVCIDQIVNLANQYNISESILGYFLLAIGTSLPELVTTWTAVRKNNGELGVGNILGANLFNLLSAMGISTFIRPVDLSNFKYDLMFLTLATLAVFVFAIIGNKYTFDKKEGIGLLLLYVLFALFQVSRT